MMEDEAERVLVALEGLDMSVRLRNALRGLGASTLGDVAMMTEREILAQRNIGKKTLRELGWVLMDHGLCFRAEPKTKPVTSNHVLGQIAAAEARRDIVHAMRAEGRTFVEIGRILGVSSVRARSIFMHRRDRRISLPQLLPAGNEPKK